MNKLKSFRRDGINKYIYTHKNESFLTKKTDIYEDYLRRIKLCH